MNSCKNILSFFLILAYHYVYAQTVDNNLNTWHKENPIEKIYLHLDRKDYFAGQTCWFKSYFLSDFLPSVHNSTLFVELINRNGEIILKKVLPVFNTVAYGQLELPDTLSTNTYHIRAYTPLMLNHSKEYLYNTSIRVYGKTLKNNNTYINNSDQLLFFPEGGTLLTDVENRIAFKGINAIGLPVNITATIKDDLGNAITQIKSTHDGMGTFVLRPQKGRVYVAQVKDKTIPLPQHVSEGTAVHLTPTSKSIHYKLAWAGGKQFTPTYLVGQMQHKVVVKQKIDSSLEGQINTLDLPSGILQCTFFNEDGIPLAERLVFINNKEYILKASLQKNLVDFKPRKKNTFSINFNQPTEGNFSISITDENYNEPGPRKDNIISSFLLTSDIPGYVHNPAFYFSDNNSAQEALDLIMLTNGWRRFNWKQVTQNHLPKPIYTDPGYISLSGKVNVRDSKKNFANRDLLAWIATSDSGRALQMLKTDAEGQFKMDSLIFFDKAKILFSDVMGNKNKFITVELNTDSLYQSYAIPILKKPIATNTNTTLHTNMQTAYSTSIKGGGVLLDNVHIEGRRLTLEELEKKYVSGMFAGNINARTINLTGQFIPQFNIFEWLMGRVPSLSVNRTSPFFDNYRLYFRKQPVQLFLDEMQMQDASFISSIPASQIALIKIYPQFIGARGNAPAIAVYTKRGEDLNEAIESTGDIIDYDGYSIIKEFYSPDYSTPPDINYSDNRLTLTWIPEIITSSSQKSIPVDFYNTDRTKKFKIVVEGVTKNGQLLMLEQVIE